MTRAAFLVAAGILLVIVGHDVRAQAGQPGNSGPSAGAAAGVGAAAADHSAAAPAPRNPPRSPRVRAVALGASAAALLILAAILLPGRVRWLIVGEDNRYSVSKFQMVTWFGCVLTAYLAGIALRWIDAGAGAAGALSIPPTLLALSGLSAVTFAGAKQITMSRLERSGNDPRIKAAPLSGPRFPRDLVSDDSGHRPDIGDTQLVMLTIIAVVMYLIRVGSWLGTLPAVGDVSLPDVDTTILGAVGIGHGAYLAKKYSGDSPSNPVPGPVLPAPLSRPVRPVR